MIFFATHGKLSQNHQKLLNKIQYYEEYARKHTKFER